MRTLALIVVVLGCNSVPMPSNLPDTGSNPPDSGADDDPETCAMTRQLQLSQPGVTDADGDGRVEPGDDITLTVILSNPGPLDHNWYPGVRMVSNDAGITGLGVVDGDWLYAMFAHTSASLSTGFHVDGNMRPGTIARFILSAEAINVHCEGVATLEYSILIQ